MDLVRLIILLVVLLVKPQTLATKVNPLSHYELQVLRYSIRNGIVDSECLSLAKRYSSKKIQYSYFKLKLCANKYRTQGMLRAILPQMRMCTEILPIYSTR